MLVSHDIVFLEEQFRETDDQHEGGHGQTICMGCDCIAHREDWNDEESKVVKVTVNTEPIVEVVPVADVIPAYIDHVSLPIQPTCEETSTQTLLIPGSKCQVKQIGKIADYLHATSLLVDINEPTTIEKAWFRRDTNKWWKATVSKYQSLEKMKMWNLVETPVNVNILHL